jgi:hypothetical protein
MVKSMSFFNLIKNSPARAEVETCTEMSALAMVLICNIGDDVDEGH